MMRPPRWLPTGSSPPWCWTGNYRHIPWSTPDITLQVVPYLLHFVHGGRHRDHAQRRPPHRGSLRSQRLNLAILLTLVTVPSLEKYLSKLYSVKFSIELVYFEFYQVTNCQHDEFSHTHFSYYANLMVIYDNTTLENQPFIMEEINHFESKKVCGREEGLTHQK